MRHSPTARAEDGSPPDGRTTAAAAASSGDARTASNDETRRAPAGAARARRALVWLALAAATTFKLYLALRTAGTLDVAAYEDFARRLQDLGGVGLYHDPGKFSPYVYLPFGVHLLRLLDWLAAATALPFAFWLRLPCVLADIGSLLVVWRHFERTSRSAPQDGAAARPRPRGGASARAGLTNGEFASLLLLALSPVSVVVSGFHGNTDPLMILFALLSVSLAEDAAGAGRMEAKARRRLELAAGVAFGMALNVKIVPLVLVPAVWLYLAGAGARLRFFGAAAGTVFVASLPYVLQEPLTIARAVLGYGSLYGSWGWSYLLAQALPDTLRYERAPHGLYGPHATYAAAGKWLAFALIAAASLWMNRPSARDGRPATTDGGATAGVPTGARPSPVAQCAVVLLIFLALTPGFGMQYLVWLVPFVAALGLLPSLVFNVVAGYFVLVSYACWFRQPPPTFCATNDYATLMLAAWFSIILLAIFQLHGVGRGPRRARRTEARR